MPRLRLSRWRLQPTDASGKIASGYGGVRRCSHLPQSSWRSSACGFLNGSHGSGTLQLGVGGAGALPIGGVAGGFGIALDRSGNVAAYGYRGFGFGTGLSGTLGPSVQVSDAQSVSDLSGPFASGSASLGLGPAGTVDVFHGPSDHGLVTGGGFTAGGGGGVSVFGGVTVTAVSPSLNVYKLAAGALGC